MPSYLSLTGRRRQSLVQPRKRVPCQRKTCRAKWAPRPWGLPPRGHRLSQASHPLLWVSLHKFNISCIFVSMLLVVKLFLCVLYLIVKRTMCGISPLSVKTYFQIRFDRTLCYSWDHIFLKISKAFLKINLSWIGTWNFVTRKLPSQTIMMQKKLNFQDVMENGEILHFISLMTNMSPCVIQLCVKHTHTHKCFLDYEIMGFGPGGGGGGGSRA